MLKKLNCQADLLKIYQSKLNKFNKNTNIYIKTTINKEINREMTDDKNYLLFALCQLMSSRLQLGFQKIIIINEPDNSKIIKNYDLECEAVETISAVLKRKIYGKLLKGFYAIRFLPRIKKKQKEHKSKAQDYGLRKKKNLKINTEGPVLADDFQNSFKPISSIGYTNFNTPTNLRRTQKQSQRQTDSLGQLLGHLRQVDKYLANYDKQKKKIQPFLSRTFSWTPGRQFKRKLILDKMSKISETIHDILEKEEKQDEGSMKGECPEDDDYKHNFNKYKRPSLKMKTIAH